MTAWHGTAAEREALLHAVANNCVCVYTEHGRVSECLAHHALHSDQCFLDHVLFVRRHIDYWRTRELAPKDAFHPAGADS